MLCVCGLCVWGLVGDVCVGVSWCCVCSLCVWGLVGMCVWLMCVGVSGCCVCVAYVCGG